MNFNSVSKKITSLLILLLLLAPMNFAFFRIDDKTEEENLKELKTNTTELLVETSAMALTLSSPTNRINFTIKSADILWDLDEASAEAMFNSSSEDVKALMGQVDLESNQLKAASKTTWGGSNSSKGNRLRAKVSRVLLLRSALAFALANHDPEWALQFLQETKTVFTNKALINRLERESKRLESSITKRIAEKDITKALELGRLKLSKGVTSDIASLLFLIYKKDKDKGAEFAKEVLKKLNSSSLTNRQSWIVIRLFEAGLNSTKADTTPMFSKSAMGNLAEILAKLISSSKNHYRSFSKTVMTGLEKYSPNSASQIKRTFQQRKSSRNSPIGRGFGNGNDSSEFAFEKQKYQERAKFQNEIGKDLSSLTKKNLSDDDRKKLISDARNKILSVNDASFRFRNLVVLASRTAGVGDKESALTILREAENFINHDPKERRDFANSRSLANAYALVDTNQSFAILENMIYRLNGVINGYIQYMQYSRKNRLVENEELIMSNRNEDFMHYLQFTPQSMRNLAEEDFARLKDLTDRFDRNEIRVEARLMIAKTLLNAVEAKEKTENAEAVAQVSNLELNLLNLEDELEFIVNSTTGNLESK